MQQCKKRVQNCFSFNYAKLEFKSVNKEITKHYFAFKNRMQSIFQKKFWVKFKKNFNF